MKKERAPKDQSNRSQKDAKDAVNGFLVSLRKHASNDGRSEGQVRSGRRGIDEAKGQEGSLAMVEDEMLRDIGGGPSGASEGAEDAVGGMGLEEGSDGVEDDAGDGRGGCGRGEGLDGGLEEGQERGPVEGLDVEEAVAPFGHV